MPNARTSRPIEGDTALIDRDMQPGGETVESAGTTVDSTVYATYSEWSDAARPYFLNRTKRPGEFTTFEAFETAPPNIRDPKSSHWHGRLAVEFHDEGLIDYARDAQGTERWSKSHRPKTAKSGVRVWVGTAAKAVAS